MITALCSDIKVPVIGGTDEYVFETVLGLPALVSYEGERPHLDRSPTWSASHSKRKGRRDMGLVSFESYEILLQGIRVPRHLRA